MFVNEITDFLLEVLKVFASYVTSPGKRVFALYLFTSLLLALFVFNRLKIKIPFLKYVFNKKVWMGKSAVIDYLFIAFNSFIKVLIIGPFLIYSLDLTMYISEYLLSTFGSPPDVFSPVGITIIFTITIVVVNDFGSYAMHWLMHRIPFLWEFHKVHHSATELNPFTQYRIHPLELIINNARGIIIKGSITGIFYYLGDVKVSIYTFLTVNVLDFLFLFWGANLRHSHVPLKYFNFLEYILISPFQHQIHHSNKEEHYDTNLGSRLAIWDHLFGTLIRSANVGKLTFGLGKREDPSYNTFLKNLMQPFYRLFK